MTFDDDDDVPELFDLLPLTLAPLRDELRRSRLSDPDYFDLLLFPDDQEDE